MPIPESKLIEIINDSRAEIGAMSIRRLQAVQARFDLDDLQQVTAMKAFANREKLVDDSEETAKHWVKKIAANTCKSALQHDLWTAKRPSLKMQIPLKEVIAPEESLAVEIADDFALVQFALTQIPATQAKAVRMVYLEMSEYAEVCSELGCSLNAARLLVSRGLAAVREILKSAE
jgi:RNA polymerase sigma factor (sigma-70 family)